MSEDKISDTQPNKTKNGSTLPVNISDTQQVQVKAKKPRRGRAILLGLLILILAAAAGGGLGYRQGILDRLARQEQQRLTEAAMQYQFGLQQLASGNYNLARSHFEYVLQIYPEFPGITEKYTEVMVKLAEAAKPTPVPAATPTITNQNAEALFNQAAQQVQSMQWEAAIGTLEALRNTDKTYRTLEVDGLYFTTLRYRAVDMIVKDGNLEEGLYLLSLVSRYAPLDHDAVNYSNWARLYLTGASFWDVDWEQVVNYFSQLAAAFPYMHDGTGWTANDRLMKGSEYYADQLYSKQDFCTAVDFYQTALNMGPTDDLQSKYNDAYLKCYPPTPKPKPTQTTGVELPTEVPGDVTPEPPSPQPPENNNP